MTKKTSATYRYLMLNSPSEVARGSVQPKKLELVDVQDPVRPVGDAVAEDVVGVVGEREEHLEEEQRHDREVVAGEPSRREADEPADDSADDHDERDRDDGRQMDVVLVGAQQRVRVRADAEKCHVAEVEQAAPPDHDVEPQREQHEDDGVERDAADVAALDHTGQQRDDGNEEREPGPPRHHGEPLLDGSEPTAAARAALAVPGHPLVATHRRARRALRGRRFRRALEGLRQVTLVEPVAHVAPTPS